MKSHPARMWQPLVDLHELPILGNRARGDRPLCTEIKQAGPRAAPAPCTGCGQLPVAMDHAGVDSGTGATREAQLTSLAQVRFVRRSAGCDLVGDVGDSSSWPLWPVRLGGRGRAERCLAHRRKRRHLLRRRANRRRSEPDCRPLRTTPRLGLCVAWQVRRRRQNRSTQMIDGASGSLLDVAESYRLGWS